MGWIDQAIRLSGQENNKKESQANLLGRITEDLVTPDANKKQVYYREAVPWGNFVDPIVAQRTGEASAVSEKLSSIGNTIVKQNDRKYTLFPNVVIFALFYPFPLFDELTEILFQFFHHATIAQGSSLFAKTLKALDITLDTVSLRSNYWEHLT